MSMKYLSTMVCMLAVLDLAAQDVQPLKPGDRLPDNLVVHHMVNSVAESTNLADIEGKAILLDFGATYCPPCIASLAKLDSLQKEFPDDLQVFMVTQESKERVTAFLDNHVTVKRMQVPVIAQDTLLHSLFRHITLPHVAWVGKDRQVKALTDHHYINKKNLQVLTEGRKIDWPVKWDFPYVYVKPMITFNSENVNTVMRPRQYRIVTNHMEGVVLRQKTTVDSAAKQVRVSAFNVPLLKMYLTLFGYIWEHDFYPAQVVLHDIQDKTQFFYDGYFGTKAAWEKEYTYCYEMTFPMDLGKGERNRKIIEQLNGFFGLKVSLKKQKRHCWVMRVSDRDKFRRRAFSAETSGYSVKGLLKAVNSIPSHEPLINELDEDEFQGKSVRLELGTGPLADFAWLKKKLEPQGIRLEVQIREVETLWVEPAR